MPGGICTENVNSRRHTPSQGEEIVISGISGKFPNSRNVAELSYNLYNKVRFVNILKLKS